MGRGDNNSGKGGGGFKLFGVYINLQDEVYNTSMESTLKKKRIHKGENVECKRSSESMGNSHELCNREEQHLVHDDPGNHSDDLLHLQSGRPAHVRKKAIPWTPSEHSCFLIGLEKLGKGNWKGISKNYVPTKTAAQIASHAQKHFLRIAAAEEQNRRASLFDIPFKKSNSPPQASTAASFNASEGSQQVTTTAVDPLKKDSENHGLDGLLVNITANEKNPSLSPATRTNASDACPISYTNSPPHAFTAASFSASEGSQQVMTAAVYSSKKDSENHGLDGLPANIATNKKKRPFSPATRTNASDACHMSYTNSNLHAFTAASFSASEGSQQVMTASVDPSKKYSEYHGLDGSPANIAAKKKKLPFSPATGTNASDACHISYTNSHLHAFTAGSRSALEGSQQVMTAGVNPSKKYSENHGLDGLPGTIAAKKKKIPFSTATRNKASDACQMSYTNSHLHAFTAGSFSASEVSQRVMTAAVDPSKKYSEYHGLNGLRGNIASKKKKIPFLPETRMNASSACHMSYTNSHLLAFNAASFNASEGSQKVMTAAVDPSKKYCENHGLDGLSANRKRFPFSPATRTNASDAFHISYTNSHLHAFTAGSCSASEGFQQVMTAAVDPSKKYSEYHGLDGLPANIAANKKLPFSPVTRTNASDAYHMSYTNSHLHSFTASESSQQVMTAAVDHSKKYSDYHGLFLQDGLRANIAANKKKLPFSPGTRANASDACHMSYTAGVPRQSFPAAHVMPQAVYSMLNYTCPGYYYGSSSHANFPAQGMFLQPHTMTHGTSQARPTTTIAENCAICAPFVNHYQTVKGPATSTVAKKRGLQASSGAPLL